MCFHLVFSFCVDLVGMVKIMQKHAKLEQKEQSAKNHKNPCKCRSRRQHAARPCAEGSSAQRQNSRLGVWSSRLDHRAMLQHARIAAHAAREVMRGEQCEARKSSRLDGFRLGKAVDWIVGSMFSINPSSRQKQGNPDSGVARPWKNHNSQSRRNFAVC